MPWRYYDWQLSFISQPIFRTLTEKCTRASFTGTTFLSLILVLICSRANVTGIPPPPTQTHALTAFYASLTHTLANFIWTANRLGLTAGGDQHTEIWERGNIAFKMTFGVKGGRLETQPCPAAWPWHTHGALPSPPCLRLAPDLCLNSLSALTTDGVLIKSSRNITVSKQGGACQLHNCRVPIQPLTCSIQTGREPTAPHLRQPPARPQLCSAPRPASPRKVNCSPCQASWHRLQRAAAIWLVIKHGHSISRRLKWLF